MHKKNTYNYIILQYPEGLNYNLKKNFCGLNPTKSFLSDNEKQIKYLINILSSAR